MTIPYLGGCLCGAVRYCITAEPMTIYACHCTECQRRTGSAFALSMPVQRDAIEVLSGQPAPYRVTFADGRVKRGQFCGACGTRLWGEPPKRPNIALVATGTLDDTSWVQPVAHVWARSAQPWFVFPAGVPVFKTRPDDPMELVNLWAAARAPRA